MIRQCRNAMFMICLVIVLLAVPRAYGAVTLFTNRQIFEALRDGGVDRLGAR